jgi:hypothetical protein|tara:strand:+ start:1385 stop:2194 length:810 start_codon:yes stop_codon:yes gene_type:complete
MINISEVSLIQELRAIHALSELKNVNININASDEHKFKLLRYNFGMSYSVGLHDGIDIHNIVEIDHSKPLTSILAVTKPLIFPKIIIYHLKGKWPKNRKYEYGFTGFITPERETVIEKWLLNAKHKSYKLKSEKIPYRIKRKIFFKLRIKKTLLKRFGNLYISASNRGRVFPGKSWDEEYYNFMLKSKFILCPSGVYIWTYRFFESILCGAIPIVEKSAPCYDGFIYYNMDEKLSDIKWAKEIAEHNYKLCVERITLSEKDIQNISRTL